MWQRVGGAAGATTVDAVSRTEAGASTAAAAAAAYAADGTGASVKLLMYYPADRSVADTLRAQEGCCAGCGTPLNGFASATLVSKGTALLRSAVAGPASHCSPRHRLHFNSRNEDSKCVG